MREKFNFLLMDFLMNFWGFGLFYQSGENRMGGSVNLKIRFLSPNQTVDFGLNIPREHFCSWLWQNACCQRTWSMNVYIQVSTFPPSCLQQAVNEYTSCESINTNTWRDNFFSFFKDGTIKLQICIKHTWINMHRCHTPPSFFAQIDT